MPAGHVDYAGNSAKMEIRQDKIIKNDLLIYLNTKNIYNIESLAGEIKSYFKSKCIESAENFNFLEEEKVEGKIKINNDETLRYYISLYELK